MEIINNVANLLKAAIIETVSDKPLC
jgi:hypothetical protein